MKIKLLIIDIDGTMTDGSIYYGEDGNEIKKFNVKDAAGIQAAQAVGIDCIFLTGRKTSAVARRADDLCVKNVFQGVKNKKHFVESYLKKNKIDYNEVIYIGDDYNDLAIMKRIEHSACPLDAVSEIAEISEYVSSYKGGEGAVKDCVFHFLRKMNVYEDAISKAFVDI